MSAQTLRRIAFVGPIAAAVVIAIIVVAASGGGSDSGSSGSASASGTVDASELKGLPKPLAENAEQASEIVDGGREALEAKLADLNGHPVVVNQWGSWCPPCREEFPFFQQSAQEHLDEVAFLGVDIQDDRGAAEDFLAEFPTPYPHVFDQDSEGVASLGWTGASPTTWLIDESGEIVNQRPGAYSSRDELEADIDRFLLQKG